MSEQAPWKRLKALEPPLGSKRRVLAKAQAEIDLSTLSPAMGRTLGHRARLPIALTIGALATAIALFVAFRSPSHDEPMQAVAKPKALVHEPIPDTKVEHHTALESAPPNAPKAQIQVQKNEDLAIHLSKAELKVLGPASVNVKSQGVRIFSGRVEVAGYAKVQGPQCRVIVNGQIDAEVSGDSLLVRVHSGTATSEHKLCVVMYMETTPIQVAVPVTETRRAKPKRAAQPEPSKLRKQISQFQHARGLMGQAGLRELRRFVHAWPNSALREQADASIVSGLSALGRTNEANVAAGKFIKRYPNSPRSLVFRDFGVRQ